MVSDVTANVHAPAVRPDELRMLDPVERKATKMAWAGADLSWQRIREAGALQAKWKREPPPPGWDPDPTPESEPAPTPDPDPDPLREVGDLSTPLPVCADIPDGAAAPESEAPSSDVSALRAQIREGVESRQDIVEQMPPVAQAEEARAEDARDAELEQLVQRRPAHRPVSISFGDVDLAQTIRAAERSGDAHARSLAARIRRLANELGAYLEMRAEIDMSHERIDALRAEVEARKRQSRRSRPHQVPPSRPTTPAAAGLKPNGDVRYATTVREWARSNGYNVADRGRISQPLIDAFIAAHPETNTAD